jgi:flagellar assembly factor FliW
MPVVATRYFGTMDYQEESVLDLPLGLPAFESEKRFVLIEQPDYDPLVFLQSLNEPSLCFLSLPATAVDPAYELVVSDEDRAVLQWRGEVRPADAGLLVLTLLSLHDGLSPTANLMAPIVVNVQNRRAVQSIRLDRKYSHEHPFALADLARNSEGPC